MCWDVFRELQWFEKSKWTRLSIKTWRQPPRSVVYTTSMNFKSIRNVLHRVFGSKLDNTTSRRSWNTFVPHKNHTLGLWAHFSSIVREMIVDQRKDSTGRHKKIAPNLLSPKWNPVGLSQMTHSHFIESYFNTMCKYSIRFMIYCYTVIATYDSGISQSK